MKIALCYIIKDDKVMERLTDLVAHWMDTTQADLIGRSRLVGEPLCHHELSTLCHLFSCLCMGHLCLVAQDPLAFPSILPSMFLGVFPLTLWVIFGASGNRDVLLCSSSSGIVFTVSTWLPCCPQLFHQPLI